MTDQVGMKIKIEGREWVVVAVLPEYLLIVTNTGIWPNVPMVIPASPKTDASD